MLLTLYPVIILYEEPPPQAFGTHETQDTLRDRPEITPPQKLDDRANQRGLAFPLVPRVAVKAACEWCTAVERLL